MILDSDPSKITRELAQQVIDHIKAFQQRTGTKNAQIAKSLAIGPSTLSQVLSLTYPGDWQQVILDLDRWLDDQLQREAAPKVSEFVRTDVAEEIMAVADAVMAMGTIGMIYGPAGIGKTLALKAVAAEKPGSLFVSMETATAGKLGVVEALARALNIYTVYQNRSCRIYLAGIREKLSGSGRLVIVDEIHKLCGLRDDEGLNVLRDLYDQTSVPMLWSGTTDLVAYLERRESANGREPLAQIRSRITPVRDLAERCQPGSPGGGEPLFTIDQVRKIFARSKMRLAPDAARYLTMLANLPDSGHLRTCKNLMVMATKLNESRSDVLTLDMLRSAHRLLVNRRGFQLLEHRLEELKTLPLAKVG
jgi:DNA transposition AAA+ family ATPase